jgi:two-component system alkaline phosphatase synthesis response regulator PhoP/two-component system response regulator VicR
MNKKILVIDDEETIRKFIKIQLGKAGYDVKEAVDGEQAMVQLKRDRFDVLICDIMMPRKNGWEVLKEVRSNPATSELPVIVLTAKNEDNDMFKGYELGATYYITKPFTKSQLLFGLNTIFDRKKNSLY